MPLYNYRCNNPDCLAEVEQQRLVADYRAHVLCSTCNEGLLDLQPAAPGFALKGGGWTPKSHGGRVK